MCKYIYFYMPFRGETFPVYNVWPTEVTIWDGDRNGNVGSKKNADVICFEQKTRRRTNESESEMARKRNKSL